ncbi:MAG: tetratricopeptide repeat protein [Deltaproteobacteria bacterium]|nr:tetratricopeptide repeat protein [Deltaproteobacteria bacterium]
MKCPRCGVPILDTKDDACSVCGFQLTGTTHTVILSGENVDSPFSTPSEDSPASPFDDGEDDGLFEISPSIEFVGRTDDLSRIEEELSRVKLNQRLAFVTVYGPVGIGKSRVINEFHQRHMSDDIIILKGEGRTSATIPFGALGQAVYSFIFGSTSMYSQTDVIEKIEEKIKDFISSSQLNETSHLLAQFLGFEIESQVIEPLLRNPSQMELRMFIAVRRLLSGISENKTLVLIIDAIDRAEPETVNLIHYLAAGLIRQQVMILTAGRDTMFTRYPHWANGEYATLRLKLPPLEPLDAEKLFSNLVPQLDKVPKSIQGHLEEHIDRSPRTIEEFARFLVESGIIDMKKSPWRVLLSKLSTTEIPRSLEGILKSRIYLLPHGDRDLLNRAAIFGENFWQDGVIAQVRRALFSDDIKEDPDGPSLESITNSADFTNNLVISGLERHRVRGFIEPLKSSILPGEKQYRFKYPPIWNIVYEAMPLAQRRLFHFQAAEWLELHLHDPTSELSEEVARHLELAGSSEKAGEKYREAAEISRAHFNNDRAIRLYIKAIAVQETSNTAQRILMWHDLGNIYEIKGLFEKSLACYEKMLRLSWINASRSKGGVAFNKMGRLYRQQGQLSLSLEYLKKGLELFETANDMRGVAGSKDDIGQVLHALGENEQAMQYCGHALEIRRSLGDNRSVAVALINIGYIEMDRGLFNEAASCFFEGLNISRQISDESTVCRALNSLGILYFHQGHTEEALEEWKKGLNIAQNIGYGPMEAKLQNNMGEALFKLGRFSESSAKLERAIELAEDMHEKRVLFDAKRNLSLVFQKMGKHDVALDYAQEALSLAKELDILEFKARAAMTLAEVLSGTVFSSDDPAQVQEAKSHFQQGIDLFKLLGHQRETGKGLKRYAEFLVEAGDEKSALESLAEAKVILGPLGVKELEEVKNLIATLKGEDEN